MLFRISRERPDTLEAEKRIPRKTLRTTEVGRNLFAQLFWNSDNFLNSIVAKEHRFTVVDRGANRVGKNVRLFNEARHIVLADFTREQRLSELGRILADIHEAAARGVG